jgi:hypothetical protein
VDDLLHKTLVLRTEFEQTRLAFIKADLAVCLTFAVIADRSFRMGHRENAEQSLANAEKGYSDLRRFFSQVTGIPAAEDEEIQSKFKALRDRLDALQRLDKAQVPAVRTPNHYVS